MAAMLRYAMTRFRGAGGRAAALALAGGSGVAYATHIETEVKLDFKDVLIRPKRSTLRSRPPRSPSRPRRCPATCPRWRWAACRRPAPPG